ncbi:glycoside hydrolase family 5 protein [Macrolepiota fuliginosa MF-IS2]|uniref:glucan 1,3-beta-glucosidase n=1 Tax=Macrolepiota fuliginosa MF-IS2 TaxID=1400762 RepID=A0A9P6C644_9AGAR|nr:glycoside hydrolase family 5 protein [Macrolepiota fuliginosa MF-IS2]
MASDQSRKILYDPLPLTSEDQRSSAALYDPPPSQASFQTTELRETDISGAAAPRFLGTALYDDPAFRPRESIAPSYNTGNSRPVSEYNSSDYALNDQNPRFGGAYRDDPNDDFYGTDLNAAPVGQPSRALEEKRPAYASPAKKSRTKIIVLAVLAGLILLILAIVIPIYFTVIRPKSSSSPGNLNSNPDNSNKGPTSKPDTPQTRVVTGGDGSEVTMDDGTKFTYTNPFGGIWYYDEEDPFNNGARAQSWSPALNETFHYGTDKIRGVNLGGWLVTEPVSTTRIPRLLLLIICQVHVNFQMHGKRTYTQLNIFSVPALFEKYTNNQPPAVDEWTLSQAMQADTAGGGINQLEDHYKTFITEKDFAEIAGAGLNYVRIPIGFWAIETRDNEPYLAHTSWQYFLKAIKWARKYGIRINIDLHALPGSQNGWNHSGRLGTVGVLNGPMGYANAQRSLDIIRVLAEFISQPQYKDVVTMFGIVNEPQQSVMGQDALTRFYLEGYNIVRNAGGTGEGNGPWVSIHDGFSALSQWAGVFPNADRLSLDSHPYICFGGQSDAPMASYRTTPCDIWGSNFNNSMGNFGLTTAGEFSNAVTDCGLWLNGVNLGTRYEGSFVGGGSRIGDCATWTDWTKYDQNMKNDIKNFALASMDALQDYFFWTWKIGNSTTSGKVESPAWSYQLGLEQGWMPTDPRDAAGTCRNGSPWQPPLQPWQTGGTGAGNIPATATSAFAWPPTTVNNGGAITLLPSYTPTGPIPTLPAPTLTAPSGSTATPTTNPGSGWNNAADNVGFAAEVSGCTYLDPWISPDTAPPSPLCAGGAAGATRREASPKPMFTPPPA